MAADNNELNSEAIFIRAQEELQKDVPDFLKVAEDYLLAVQVQKEKVKIPTFLTSVFLRNVKRKIGELVVVIKEKNTKKLTTLDAMKVLFPLIKAMSELEMGQKSKTIKLLKYRRDELKKAVKNIRADSSNASLEQLQAAADIYRELAKTFSNQPSQFMSSALFPRKPSVALKIHSEKRDNMMYEFQKESVCALIMSISFEYQLNPTSPKLGEANTILDAWIQDPSIRLPLSATHHHAWGYPGRTFFILIVNYCFPYMNYPKIPTAFIEWALQSSSWVFCKFFGEVLIDDAPNVFNSFVEKNLSMTPQKVPLRKWAMDIDPLSKRGGYGIDRRIYLEKLYDGLSKPNKKTLLCDPFAENPTLLDTALLDTAILTRDRVTVQFLMAKGATLDRSRLYSYPQNSPGSSGDIPSAGLLQPRGNESIRQIRFIIFDLIHGMRNRPISETTDIIIDLRLIENDLLQQKLRKHLNTLNESVLFIRSDITDNYIAVSKLQPDNPDFERSMYTQLISTLSLYYLHYRNQPAELSYGTPERYLKTLCALAPNKLLNLIESSPSNQQKIDLLTEILSITELRERILSLPSEKIESLFFDLGDYHSSSGETFGQLAVKGDYFELLYNILPPALQKNLLGTLKNISITTMVLPERATAPTAKLLLNYGATFLAEETKDSWYASLSKIIEDENSEYDKKLIEQIKRLHKKLTPLLTNTKRLEIIAKIDALQSLLDFSEIATSYSPTSSSQDKTAHTSSQPLPVLRRICEWANLPDSIKHHIPALKTKQNPLHKKEPDSLRAVTAPIKEASPYYQNLCSILLAPIPEKTFTSFWSRSKRSSTLTTSTLERDELDKPKKPKQPKQ